MSRERWLILRHHLVLAFVLVGLLTAFIPVAVVEADTVVYFPDPNLQAGIRELINKPTGDIYQSDFAYRRVLEQPNGTNRGIVDLTGLEYWTTVEDLELMWNQIVSLSPLAGLPNLQILKLLSNQVIDLSPLAGCPKLWYVEVDDNQIATLGAIASLKYLGASNNRISDLSPLAGCPNLQDLGAGNNQIVDLSPLAGLPNLERLGAPNNQISDLSPLASCPKLSSMTFGNNQIATLVPIASLQYLEVSNNQIVDLSPLAGCPNLQWLYADNNQISDLSALQGLTGLVTLDLADNQISDIEPLVNNSGMGSGDKLDLRSNPLSSQSVDTWIPELIARGVTVLWDQNTINGCVEDGYTHKISGVAVTLLDVTSGNPTTEEVTITDDGGEYSFEGIDAGDYQIEVALECHRTAGDTAVFSVNHGATGPVVSAQTPSFSFASGELARDITFADADLVPAAGIPQDRLDDLAGMYYHVKQAVDFERTELAFTPDLSLPILVHGYVPDNPSTPGNESQGVWYSAGDVYIGAGCSAYANSDRPMNRDWHEMFHELMDDAVGLPPYHTGDTNHDGFKNHCTGDSWVEGWAEFWSCALKQSLGGVDWRVYQWAGGNTNLEYTWRAWDDEEFAVASLLIDLADPVDPADGDYVSLTNGQLWAIIGTQSLPDMSSVYAALVAANVGQLDTDADNVTDLDELFTTHGFFADDGNQQYDGEPVGLGGQPGRTDKPPIPGASLRILVEDSQGDPVSNGTLLVDVTYPSPMDIYNYSYEVSLSGSDSQVGFYVAPDGDEALMTMRVRDGGDALSDVLVVSNSVYWDRVSEATKGYAAEHTFVIGAEGKTTELGASEANSGGVPVWVWPAVGVAVVAAAGAGGFLLFRRKAKAS